MFGFLNYFEYLRYFCRGSSFGFQNMVTLVSYLIHLFYVWNLEPAVPKMTTVPLQTDRGRQSCADSTETRGKTFVYIQPGQHQLEEQPDYKVSLFNLKNIKRWFLTIKVSVRNRKQRLLNEIMLSFFNKPASAYKLFQTKISVRVPLQKTSK